jgi:hypothetical protein
MYAILAVLYDNCFYKWADKIYTFWLLTDEYNIISTHNIYLTVDVVEHNLRGIKYSLPIPGSISFQSFPLYIPSTPSSPFPQPFPATLSSIIHSP